MVRRRLRLGAARSDSAVREAQQGRLGVHRAVQLQLPVPAAVPAELAAAAEPESAAPEPATPAIAAHPGGPGREQHVTLATHVHQHRMINLTCMFLSVVLSLLFLVLKCFKLTKINSNTYIHTRRYKIAK